MVRTAGLFFAALTSRAFCRSTGTEESFDEVVATLKFGTAGLFRAALALLALGAAARTVRRVLETSRTLVTLARCLHFAAFLVRATAVIATNRRILKIVLVKTTSSTLVLLAGCLLVAADVLRALCGIAATR